MARYTPRLIAYAKRRYEGTDEPMPSIALSCHISLRTLHRMVDREGWKKRGKQPPLDLPNVAALVEEAEALVRVLEARQRQR